jgi:hypothetical protein
MIGREPPMRTLLAISSASWLLGAAAPARAFVRETVEGDPRTPLYWDDRSVTIRGAWDTCADLPPDAVRDAVVLAMGTWEAAGEGCTDFAFVEGAAPSGTATNLAGGAHDRENRIVWREDAWPDDVSHDALAVTTLVYDASSGEILDADIDVNGVDWYWTTSDEPGSIVTDVQNTITHELGHLLGFAHSLEVEATMYGRADPGETKTRGLHEDAKMILEDRR